MMADGDMVAIPTLVEELMKCVQDVTEANRLLEGRIKRGQDILQELRQRGVSMSVAGLDPPSNTVVARSVTPPPAVTYGPSDSSDVVDERQVTASVDTRDAASIRAEALSLDNADDDARQFLANIGPMFAKAVDASWAQAENARAKAKPGAPRVFTSGVR